MREKHTKEESVRREMILTSAAEVHYISLSKSYFRRKYLILFATIHNKIESAPRTAALSAGTGLHLCHPDRLRVTAIILSPCRLSRAGSLLSFAPSSPPGADRRPELPLLNQEGGGWHPESGCPPLDSHTPLCCKRVGWICLRLAQSPPLPPAFSFSCCCCFLLHFSQAQQTNTLIILTDAALHHIRTAGSSWINSQTFQGSWIPTSPSSGSTSQHLSSLMAPACMLRLARR